MSIIRYILFKKISMVKNSAEINNKTEVHEWGTMEKKANEWKNDAYIKFWRNLKSCNLVSNKGEKSESINKISKSLCDISWNDDEIQWVWKNDNEELWYKEEKTESLEMSLLHNEELPILINNVLEIYRKNQKRNAQIIQDRIDKNKKNILEESERDNIPTFDEFLKENDNEYEFEEYLLSEECIKWIILNYLKRFTDKSWNIWKISEKDLMATITWEWRANLWREYNITYELINDEKYKNINLIFEIWNTIKNSADNAVHDCLNWNELATRLDSISEFIGDKDNIREYANDDNSLDHLNILLKNSIKEYYHLINQKDNTDTYKPLKKTNDEIFDLQIRSYLYLYWKIFYKEYFQTRWWNINNYESDLNDILLAILAHDGDLKGVKSERQAKLLEVESKRAKALTDRQNKAREDAFRRNREKNEWIKNRDIKWSWKENRNKKEIDIQTASGAAIAREQNLWQRLNEFTMKRNPNNSEEMFLYKSALRRACTNLINEREDYRSYFSINDFMSFFDINAINGSLSINDGARRNFKAQYEGIDLPESWMLLFCVQKEFNKEKENLNTLNQEIIEKCSETTRNHAIGAVIDNIKSIFNDLTIRNTQTWNEWFRYDETTPVKIENGHMIISWYFRWEKVKVSYDIWSWEISINSFVTKIWDYLKIGDSEKIIGSIEPFQQIFDNFCKKPTDSLVDDIYKGDSWYKNNYNSNNRWEKRRNHQIKLTNRMRLQQTSWIELDRIGEGINSGTMTNLIVSWMLKTLNILPENTKLEGTTALFKEWTDLYYYIQTVQNSVKKHKLWIDAFIKMIPELVKYLWLTWNMNNEHQIKDESNPIFNPKWNSDWNSDWKYDRKYDILDYLKKNWENFDKETSRVDSAKFDNKENFWLLKIINEKFVKGTPPNQHFDELKIKEFIPMIEDTIRTRNLIS